jgi:hypothetical protein
MLDEIQRSGRGIWFALDAYELGIGEFVRAVTLRKPPQVPELDRWLLQPHTVLNLGIASSLDLPGRGGAVQAEFVYGSPLPIPLDSRKVRQNVRM